MTIPAAARGRELYLLGGKDTETDRGESSYSWQLGYTQQLAPHLASSFSYLNEGHFLDHRRDGYSLQLWARTDLLEDRLSLGAGAGPYLFFDTTNGAGGDYINKHGWRGLVSLDATWHTESNLLFLVRSNYSIGDSDPDTISALAGIGYQFENEGRDRTVPWEKANNEITFLAGQTIVNSKESQRSVALSIEYRHALLRHMDWTLALLDEGDTRLNRRDGIVTQLWATQELHRNRITVSAGGGAYFDIKHNHSSGSAVLAIIALSTSYRMTPHWALRINWSRVISDNDRDTDVLLAGLGYRF